MSKSVKEWILKIFSYWKKPPEGRYMSFKEIAALSVGGMGVKFIINVMYNMVLCVGNTLIGNTIGIPQMSLYFIYVLSIAASIPLTAVRARIIDNSHNKKGKYRPYILYMAIPTSILGIGFVMMPYTSMTLFWKCFTVLAYNIGFQFFYSFLNDAYENIINVLSPNTYERADVFSIKGIVDSIAPSIMNVALPLIAQAVTGDRTIYDMRVYRVYYPPILIIGTLLSIIIHVGTEEKIVLPKEHKIQISFIDAFISVARNKYFWIISLASWLGFLEGSFANILGWMYNYQHVCSAGQYALITTIYGNSALWAMVAAPFLVRSVGKKKILVYSNLLNIAFIAVMYPVVKTASTNSMVWMFLICLFINNIASQITVTITPSINGDMRDYQQYITGERVDGVFSVVGLIGSIFGLITGLIPSIIYDRAGLNAETAVSLGYSADNVYDVLFNEQYFRNICCVLIVTSVVGAIMNVIPYFFYDLSENKQKAMVYVLKIRALFEDFANGKATDEEMVEVTEIINNAYKLKGTEPKALTRSIISKENPSLSKKEVSKLYKANKKLNNDIETSSYVIAEMEYFNNPLAVDELERAERIIAAGPSGLAKLTTITVEQAKALPKETDSEKSFRSHQIELARDEIRSKKIIEKYYKDGIGEFDKSVFDELFNKEDEKDALMKKAYADNDKAKAKEYKKEKDAVKKEIKVLTKEYSRYNRAIKPYNEAVKLIRRKENMEHFDAIASQYDELKAKLQKA